MAVQITTTTPATHVSTKGKTYMEFAGADISAAIREDGINSVLKAVGLQGWPADKPFYVTTGTNGALGLRFREADYRAAKGMPERETGKRATTKARALNPADQGTADQWLAAIRAGNATLDVMRKALTGPWAHIATYIEAEMAPRPVPPVPGAAPQAPQAPQAPVQAAPAAPQGDTSAIVAAVLAALAGQPQAKPQAQATGRKGKAGAKAEPNATGTAG